MLSKIFSQNVKELFVKKKYEEVIKKIEEFSSKKDRPAGLSNLIGICKILKSDRDKKEVISALSDFEDSYSKSKKSEVGVEALTNFITTCVTYIKKYQEITDYLPKAKKMYEEIEKHFDYHEKLFTSGSDLYQYLLDQKKTTKLLKSLIHNNSRSKITVCKYGFINNYHYEWKQKDYFEYSKNFSNYFPKFKTKNLNEINYKKNPKIKIGFVSCDFTSNHSVTYFTKDTIKHLDKNIFETYSFSLNEDKYLKSSSLELKNNFDKWYDLSRLKNEDIVKFIQKEQIEILIDVMGLTKAPRIEIFNNRICPIQISWLAFCNTVGFSAIDYLIADKNVVYESEEKFYAEKIIKMPEIWNCHSGFKLDRKLSKLPFNKNKYITFGSFNNFLKLSDNVIKVWSKILQNIDNSKLILKSYNSYNIETVLDKFRKYNVENSIIIYDRSDYSDLKDHLDLYDNIDIALDTFPYNGVTTTFEALWKGVPVLVLKGYNFNSRCGESILKNANLELFISSNEEEYIEKAGYFSKNIKKLESERNKIYNEILNTPLFNSKNFSSNLKNELLKIYKNK
tara:strand:- start:2302 stop:3996 length:1695 start_codon:yes stop_codon:yes gene_type:complete